MSKLLKLAREFEIKLGQLSDEQRKGLIREMQVLELNLRGKENDPDPMVQRQLARLRELQRWYESTLLGPKEYMGGRLSGETKVRQDHQAKLEKDLS